MNPYFSCEYNHNGIIHTVMYSLNRNNTVSWKNVPSNDLDALTSPHNWQKAILFNHESAAAWFNKQVKLWCQIAIMQNPCQSDCKA